MHKSWIWVRKRLHSFNHLQALGLNHGDWRLVATWHHPAIQPTSHGFRSGLLTDNKIIETFEASFERHSCSIQNQVWPTFLIFWYSSETIMAIFVGCWSTRVPHYGFKASYLAYFLQCALKDYASGKALWPHCPKALNTNAPWRNHSRYEPLNFWTHPPVKP